MSNKPEIDDSEDSSSDEDYVPNLAENENLSEVDSASDDDDEEVEEAGASKLGKRRHGSKETDGRDPKIAKTNKNDSSESTKTDNKKRIDDLWADFKKDTGFTSKNSTNKNNDSKEIISQKNIGENPSSSSTDTSVSSIKTGDKLNEEKIDAKKDPINVKKQSGGGLNSLLGQLGKKQKISTLEKSKLDWDRFKKDENIEDDLEIYNKGKNGYLDKQDFLQRADMRTFEIEKKMRTVERNKRN